MQLRIFFFLMAFVVSATAFGQINYHRNYPLNISDTTFLHFHSAGDNAGNPIILGATTNDQELFDLLLTRHNYKGDIMFQKRIDLGRDSVSFDRGSDIAYDPLVDSIYFLVNAEVNGDPTFLYGAIDKDGGDASLEVFQVGSEFANGVTNGLSVFPFLTDSKVLLLEGDETVVVRMQSTDSVYYAQEIGFEDEQGTALSSVFYQMSANIDSLMSIGSMNVEDTRLNIAQVDSNLVQQWARSYMMTPSAIGGHTLYEVTANRDQSTLACGSFTDGTSGLTGFILMVDTLGDIVFSKSVDLLGSNTTVTNCFMAEDGNIWFSGHRSLVTDSLKFFTGILTPEGDLITAANYGDNFAALQFAIRSTSLLSGKAFGGATYVANGLPQNQPEDPSVLSVMRHNATGNTLCSDTIELVLGDIQPAIDTLILTTEPTEVDFQRMGQEIKPVSFDVKTLSLQSYSFCPNEPIDTFLVATVGSPEDQEFTSYLWSDGSTDDSLRIFEPMIGEMEKQFSVTVTINNEVCYILCDTTSIMRTMAPSLSVDEDYTQWCETGLVGLTAQTSNGTPPFEFEWSTGETTQSINGIPREIYTVTVTDGCEDTDNARATPDLPMADLVLAQTINCDVEPPVAELFVANYSYNIDVGPVDIDMYEWSNGSQNPFIPILSDGAFQLTITDNCGNTEQAVFSGDAFTPLTADGYSVNFEVICDEENPDESSVEVNIDVSGNADVNVFIVRVSDQQVVGDQNTTSLPIDDYVVNLSDGCGTTFSEEINALAECTQCIRYAAAFFPQGEDEVERSFGPEFQCGLDNLEETYQDFEFKVINRWGQIVFETTDVNQRWDGRFDGETAPTEVYVYFVTYILDGEAQKDVGDVTVLR